MKWLERPLGRATAIAAVMAANGGLLMMGVDAQPAESQLLPGVAIEGTFSVNQSGFTIDYRMRCLGPVSLSGIAASAEEAVMESHLNDTATRSLDGQTLPVAAVVEAVKALNAREQHAPNRYHLPASCINLATLDYLLAE